ncbi:MAG: DUF2934 domain-containing protein [Verrucomicrobia bacterium]|nr:DUF2934 domain-containing protein [Verrucomicrobiota bacterium]
MKKLKPKKNSPTLLIADGPGRKPTRDEIALCAYSIWEREGRSQGRELQHWLQAEAVLRQSPQQVAIRT